MMILNWVKMGSMTWKASPAQQNLKKATARFHRNLGEMINNMYCTTCYKTLELTYEHVLGLRYFGLGAMMYTQRQKLCNTLPIWVMLISKHILAKRK